MTRKGSHLLGSCARLQLRSAAAFPLLSFSWEAQLNCATLPSALKPVRTSDMQPRGQLASLGCGRERLKRNIHRQSSVCAAFGTRGERRALDAPVPQAGWHLEGEELGLGCGHGFSRGLFRAARRWARQAPALFRLHNGIARGTPTAAASSPALGTRLLGAPSSTRHAAGAARGSLPPKRWQTGREHPAQAAHVTALVEKQAASSDWQQSEIPW